MTKLEKAIVSALVALAFVALVVSAILQSVLVAAWACFLMLSAIWVSNG